MSGRRTVSIRARIQEASRPAVVDAAWLKGAFAHGLVQDVVSLHSPADDNADLTATIVVDVAGLPQAAVLLAHPEAHGLWHKTIEAQFIGGWCDVVGDA
jgi:hypothetical protein